MQPNILGDPLPLRPSHERTSSRSFPDTPTTELPPIQPHRDSISSASNHTLPSLSSVTSGLKPSTEPTPPTHWPSLNPYTTFYTPSYAQPAETPPPRHSGAEISTASPDRFSERRSGSVSLDDPDVKIAAEALSHLRADFVSVSSPPNHNTSLPTTPRDQKMGVMSPRDSSEQHTEPLLSLITASHPLVATTIEGAASAYNSGKDLSTHLKTSAEYIEGYLTPVAKVVGNVSRKTGVEGGVRWFLSRKHARKHQSGTDLEAGGNKRRKAKLTPKEMEVLDRAFPKLDDDRRASISTVDTLPAYDDHRSPAYSEEVDVNGQAVPNGEAQPWKTRIVVSTSSLRITIQADSLSKLRYCLQQLRHANSRVTSMMNNLQSLVDQYDAAGTRNDSNGAGDSSRPSEDRSSLIAQMEALKKAIAENVKSAINLVSNYAGSTLPENVQNLIREQINGLPARWRLSALREASTDEATAGGNDQEKAMREGARRVLLLAKEGLHLFTQISDVIDRTIKTAENWCTPATKNQDGADARVGGSDRAPSLATWAVPQPQPTVVGIDQDTHMTG
ncbi:clock-controlled protein 8 [Podospora aff. communis PSN243]|uniref:Clock-controlled protein 8 n=1 Tax=Podospora aff. communis PSN243 TaxID=3040156 RepID=A0AAV9G8T9_9PEZI|nr:clock-controlled protein 8 [Podospora aff. communis PSN243]